MKISVVICTWVLLGPALAARGKPRTFPEVPFSQLGNAWKYDSVQRLVELGIIDERFSAERLRPYQVATRYEAVAVLARAMRTANLGSSSPSPVQAFLISDLAPMSRKRPPGPAFPDVPSTHWIYDEIQKLTELNIILGDDRGCFNGRRAITREEFATWLSRSLFVLPRPVELDLRGNRIFFADVDDQRYSLGPIIAAAGAGLIVGDEHHRFRPRAPLRRDEMAEMTVRFLKLGRAL